MMHNSFRHAGRLGAHSPLEITQVRPAQSSIVVFDRRATGETFGAREEPTGILQFVRFDVAALATGEVGLEHTVCPSGVNSHVHRSSPTSKNTLKQRGFVLL
jgi:hypothetical protein